MNEMNMQELQSIEGGRTLSDYFFLAGGIAACFVSPWVGVPLVVGSFLASE